MLRKLFTFFAFVLSVALYADDYTFVEGVNTVKSYTPANATFTPDRDGKVLVEAIEVWKVSYDGKDVAYNYVPGGGYAYIYEVDGVKAGTPVSIVNDFPFSGPSRVKITMYGNGPVPVQMTNVTPRTGVKFDWNTTGLVSVNFNKSVTLSSIKLVAGDYTADVDDVHVGSSLGFNITNALNAALDSEKLKAGEKFQIVIKGLSEATDRSNLYNGNGELVLEYIAPYAQHNFVSATVGENKLTYLQANTYKFLSYYAPDAEDGLFVFEFDGEIGKVGGVVMTMGNLDLDAQGKYHRSSLPYKVQGNKLIVDARGKLRTLAVLFPNVIVEEPGEGEEVNDERGSYDTEHVTITLQNVIDVNGNAFLCLAQGSVGSYSFVMNYEEIVDEAYIDGDNKADGEDVLAGEEISLWLSNAGIKFDALEVSYYVVLASQDSLAGEYEKRTVTVKDFVAEPDPLEGLIISFTMPEMPGVVAGTTVRVALQNASSADGMPHYLYIEFVAGDVMNALGGVLLEGGAGKNTPAYRIDGVRALDKLTNGIYVKDGKKMLKTK